MSYERDFTIGLRETQDFHLSLVLRRWWKGAIGFGVVGVLVVWMYLYRLIPDSPPAVVAVVAGIFGVLTAAGVLAALAITTRMKVRDQLSRSGQGPYVQSTRIDGFGVQVRVGKKKAKLPFDRLLRVRETRKAFYLFIAEEQAWLLPKAQMEDVEKESAQLRRIFRAVVESRRLELKKK